MPKAYRYEVHFVMRSGRTYTTEPQTTIGADNVTAGQVQQFVHDHTIAEFGRVMQAGEALDVVRTVGNLGTCGLNPAEIEAFWTIMLDERDATVLEVQGLKMAQAPTQIQTRPPKS